MLFHHVPVMTQEVLNYLEPGQGKVFVDCTFGGGGHARAILEALCGEGILIGIDWDREAITHAKEILKSKSKPLHLFHGNFIQLPDFLLQLKIQAVDGILIDLGVSLQQIECSGRGFSFKKDEPLDMRMDEGGSMRAEDLINDLNEKELDGLFKSLGEERFSKRIARSVTQARKNRRIQTTRELVEIISRAVPSCTRDAGRIHPATRIFMALRIAVNRELENLSRFLVTAVETLNPRGRLCIISFHSLEDRIVKHRFREWEHPCTCPPDFPKCICHREPIMKVVTRKPVRPSEAEVRKNPMARSAKLRVAMRCGGDAPSASRGAAGKKRHDQPHG